MSRRGRALGDEKPHQQTVLIRLRILLVAEVDTDVVGALPAGAAVQAGDALAAKEEGEIGCALAEKIGGGGDDTLARPAAAIIWIREDSTEAPDQEMLPAVFNIADIRL